jgi:transcriptional regulator with XRE-family HTH domain
MQAAPTAPRRRYGTRPAPVRSAHAAYERRRLYLAGTGRWQPRTGAAPARAHIARLQQQHMTLQQVAAAAGVGDRSVSAIRAGQAHVRPATAAAILAVAPAARPETGLVPATGTVRRLRALMLAGWPASVLAGELGYQTHALRRLATSGQFTPAPTASGARVLYDRLWDKPGPSERTSRNAVQRGWAPAMAWDDDTIDDPAAQPQGIRPARRGSYRRAADVIEDAEELIRWGLTPAQAAERLGISRASLDQARRRRRLRLAAAGQAAAAAPVPLALTSGGAA